MKKVFVLLTCCALLSACNNSSETNGGYEDAYNSKDASGDETSAAARQSEVDTNINNTGTDGMAAADGQLDHGDYSQGENLIASSDCLSCHQVDKKLVGPAYQDVAQKYEFTDENVNYLAKKIQSGGAGVWGQVPMTPHPDLSDENAKEMAKYVLSLRK